MSRDQQADSTPARCTNQKTNTPVQRLAVAPGGLTGLQTNVLSEGYHTKRRGSRISCEFEMLVRNILLSKGRMSVPWQISMRIRGKRKASEIVPVMQILADEGLGALVHLSSGYSGKPRQIFIKKEAEDVVAGLMKYCISLQEYKERYSIEVKEHEKTYKVAIAYLTQNQGRGNSETSCIILE
jgi:hypothetical protein